MALSLRAEQMNLSKLWGDKNIFEIPAYQRPYSWEYEHCEQLYEDITEAFDNNVDYFLGNIIIARSKALGEEYRPNVVDGQQRLLTLFLVAKVLTYLCPVLKTFRKLLYVTDNREENNYSKFISNLYETDDQTIIQTISKWTDDDIKQRLSGNIKDAEDISQTRLYVNLFQFFQWFSEYKHNLGEERFEKFVEYYFENIYLLPIQLDGSTLQEASEKALVIFETLNNRGMSLENADILKAQLYENARNIGEQEQFIQSWKDLRNDCDELKISIDDLFRYYYHIIRGKEGIQSAEKKLRDFFLKTEGSPLKKYKYDSVLDDLNKVINILQFISQSRTSEKEYSIWVQIVDAYSNKYPLFALVAYLFNNGLDCDEKKFTAFLQSLVRYVYSKGSTTSIKFEIYSIIYSIFYEKPIPAYNTDKQSVNLEWKKVSPLRKGFALLAFVVTHPDFKSYEELVIDRVNSLKTRYTYNSLGNLVVLDCGKSRGTWERKRTTYSNRTKNKTIREELLKIEDRDAMLNQRTQALNRCLEDFFKNKTFKASKL